MHATLRAVEKPEPTHLGRLSGTHQLPFKAVPSQMACELGGLGLPLLSALRVLVVLVQITLPSLPTSPWDFLPVAALNRAHIWVTNGVGRFFRSFLGL